MTLLEQDSHVFIVRVRREPREIEGAPPLWRGVVEHQPGGEQRHWQKLDDLSTFIASFLAGIDSNPNRRRTVKGWLSRLRFQIWIVP